MHRMIIALPLLALAACASSAEVISANSDHPLARELTGGLGLVRWDGAPLAFGNLNDGMVPAAHAKGITATDIPYRTEIYGGVTKYGLWLALILRTLA